MARVRRIVVTGGPGSGKSTLLDRLGAAGYARSEEAGRGVIRDQLAVGGAALPWADRALFAELMLCWELRNYRSAAGGTVLFDRGLPDIAGYLRVEGLAVPAHVHAAARDLRYERRVFLAPPWPEIYRTDEERAQSPEVARRTCEVMAETYAEYGYDLVELPKAPVDDRARFVRDAIEDR
ncbi:AAA family ATPase [Saccharopolyspora gloriosae]|uniref:Putative ATPase n=1 Tax=Saccharopolyspora gloriosae TaxID=455344 RepID=A0A840NG71_9PSEU|nr:putative ATPase [Saccharopolyspora gloriosae]